MQIMVVLCTLVIVGLSVALLSVYLRLSKLRSTAAEEPQAR
jgi:NhaP-type Na+/H+ or K+/H+ antiporter